MAPRYRPSILPRRRPESGKWAGPAQAPIVRTGSYGKPFRSGRFWNAPLPARGSHRVRQQAGDGHRTHTAGHRRDAAGMGERLGISDVAHQLSLATAGIDTVDAHIDHHG